MSFYVGSSVRESIANPTIQVCLGSPVLSAGQLANYCIAIRPDTPASYSDILVDCHKADDFIETTLRRNRELYHITTSAIAVNIDSLMKGGIVTVFPGGIENIDTMALRLMADFIIVCSDIDSVDQPMTETTFIQHRIFNVFPLSTELHPTMLAFEYRDPYEILGFIVKSLFSHLYKPVISHDTLIEMCFRKEPGDEIATYELPFDNTNDPRKIELTEKVEFYSEEGFVLAQRAHHFKADSLYVVNYRKNHCCYIGYGRDTVMAL